MVQLYAARIVTGLLIKTSRAFIYLETGWEPLFNRRNRSKLSTMYTIYNNLVPSYLKEITHAFRNTFPHYNSNYSLPRCKFEVFNKSFFSRYFL